LQTAGISVEWRQRLIFRAVFNFQGKSTGRTQKFDKLLQKKSFNKEQFGHLVGQLRRHSK
jgi:hypothetical protein